MQLGLSELILWAMEKEKTSFRLYIDMLGMVEDKQSRQTLMELAEEEARHKMRFEVEYDKLLASRQEPPV
jgi:rubrerythrin